MIDVASEKERRLNLWHIVSKERLGDLEPQRLRDLGVYGGAQGIWVDKARTASPEIGQTERPSQYFIQVAPMRTTFRRMVSFITTQKRHVLQLETRLKSKQRKTRWVITSRFS
jgi:hypothetical protein